MSRRPEDVAQDVVTQLIRTHHAAALKRLTALRMRDAATYATKRNEDSRMQLSRTIRYEEALVRAWARALDSSYGTDGEGDR